MTAPDPIGVVRTPRRTVDGTPVQSVLNWEEAGAIHLDPHYAAALDGLEDVTHCWVLSWLHQPGQPIGRDVELHQVPFLLRPNGPSKGVFATRSPRRPNPIGLHLVRITGIVPDPPVISFTGVDMADGTPVLDVKPWVAHFDVPPDPDPRAGWLDHVDFQRTTPAELDPPDVP